MRNFQNMDHYSVLWPYMNSQNLLVDASSEKPFCLYEYDLEWAVQLDVDIFLLKAIKTAAGW